MYFAIPSSGSFSPFHAALGASAYGYQRGRPSIQRLAIGAASHSAH